MTIDLTAFSAVELQRSHFSIFRQDAREIDGVAIDFSRKYVWAKPQTESRQGSAA
jgi:hypothetical protein